MSKDYVPWYSRYPERFEEEVADMAKRGFVLKDEALNREKRVVFVGNSSVEPERQLRVEYPGAFPSMPPKVYASGKLIPRHHHPVTGEICLFGPGQTRWSATRSGAEAVDEAEEVIRMFSAGSSAVMLDEVPEPASAFYPYKEDAAILVPPGVATPPLTTPSYLKGSFRVRFRPVNGRGIILNARLQEWYGRADTPFNQWCSGGQEENGHLVWCPNPLPILRGPHDLKELLRDLSLERRNWMAFIFPEQSGNTSGRRLGWVVLRTFANGTFHYVRTFPYRRNERMARVPGLDGLASKKVLFIGCGCMGSKIAVALAATGVQHFTLVDPDIMKPDNSVRHEVGVDGYGDPKVNALALRLSQINPLITIKGLRMRIGDIPSGAEEKAVVDLISSADLVVETTGSHGVSRWVNDICHYLAVPSLYATVTNGAWGGEIVRVIPGRTACWQCWYQQYELDRPPSAPAPEVGFFAPGCDQPTFTGTTYEVGIVANLAAWVAVETLLRNEPGRKDFRGNYIRWSARTSEGVPDLAPAVLEIHKRPGCPVCNPL